MSNRTITVRFFVASDCTCILEAKNEIDGAGVREETLRQFASQPNNFLIVAKVNDTFAGLASGYYLQEIDGVNTAFLYELDVIPAFQQQGVATEIISFLINDSKERGCTQLWAVASKSNQAAMALYSATGATPANDQAVVWEYVL